MNENLFKALISGAITILLGAVLKRCMEDDLTRSLRDLRNGKYGSIGETDGGVNTASHYFDQSEVFHRDWE